MGGIIIELWLRGPWTYWLSKVGILIQPAYVIFDYTTVINIKLEKKNTFKIWIISETSCSRIWYNITDAAAFHITVTFYSRFSIYKKN